MLVSCKTRSRCVIPLRSVSLQYIYLQGSDRRVSHTLALAPIVRPLIAGTIAMLFKASVFLAVPAALTPVIASALLPRDCSGRTPYIILSVHEWLKIDVLDKDPAIPSQQWGQYGVFTKSFNFSVEDKYYTEHFIATSFLEQGEWDAVPHEALVAGQQYDVSDTRMPLGSRAHRQCRITAEEGVDQKYCGKFIHLNHDGTIQNQAEGDGKGGTVRANCTPI